MQDSDIIGEALLLAWSGKFEDANAVLHDLMDRRIPTPEEWLLWEERQDYINEICEKARQ